MSTLILAWLAGVLTIATPCILPVLPFVAAGSGRPFLRGSLPLLLGLAVAFAAVASLAAFAGGWAVAANRYGRDVALVLMFLFGLTLLSPALAARLMQPLVALGGKVSQRAGGGVGSSLLLGVATGLLWAPCAGPVLGLILAGAALRGPGLGTSLLLLTYGLGAASSLAVGLLLGRRLLAPLQRSAAWSERLRRVLGAGVVAGTVAILFGLDSGALTRWSSSRTNALELHLIDMLGVAGTAEASAPLAAPELSRVQKALLGASQWLNTPGLRAEDLQGKVVLVNFWTYSCINCLRTLPYVRAWADKYRDSGLVVLGVHTPEFAFEKDPGNVRTALATLGVRYPVALDNDFGIWRRFDNEAWPALYFLDSQGRVRHRVLGEGEYAQSERLIQQLLAEASGAAVAAPVGAVSGDGTQAAADPADQRSDETYLGYEKGSGLASPGGFEDDAPKLYRAATGLALNHWSLAGNWTVSGEYAVLKGETGSIDYRFHARDLHLVMGLAAAGNPVRFRVTIDGAPPGASHGSDTDAEGWGTVSDHKLYQLVRQAGPVQDHTFEISIYGAGVRAYAFTFG